MTTGIFITIEGPDGAGKTTLINSLVPKLEEELLVGLLSTREPGGSLIAEKIRNLILDENHTNMDARTEALLFAASRRQHLVEKVWPAMEDGKLVLCDRFVDSSIAYQAYGRDLGVDGILAINQFATENTEPDLTIYLELDAELGLERINKNRQGDQLNRLDQESVNFHRKVCEGYDYLLGRFPNRIKAVDASQSPEKVLTDVYQIIRTEYPLYFKED